MVLKNIRNFHPGKDYLIRFVSICFVSFSEMAENIHIKIPIGKKIAPKNLPSALPNFGRWGTPSLSMNELSGVANLSHSPLFCSLYCNLALRAISKETKSKLF